MVCESCSHNPVSKSVLDTLLQGLGQTARGVNLLLLLCLHPLRLRAVGHAVGALQGGAGSGGIPSTEGRPASTRWAATTTPWQGPDAGCGASPR